MATTRSHASPEEVGIDYDVMMPDYLVRYGADDEDMQAPLEFIFKDEAADDAAAAGSDGGVSPSSRRSDAEAAPPAPKSPLRGVWVDAPEPASPEPDWAADRSTVSTGGGS